MISYKNAIVNIKLQETETVIRQFENATCSFVTSDTNSIKPQFYRLAVSPNVAETRASWHWTHNQLHTTVIPTTSWNPLESIVLEMSRYGNNTNIKLWGPSQ